MRFRHLPHTMRLAGFVLCGAMVTAVVSARHARAQAHEGMRRLARQLMPYAEQGAIEAPRRVHINGESVYLATGVTQDSVAAVLDYYEARCERTGGHLSDTLSPAQREALARAGHGQVWGHAGRLGPRVESFREGNDDEGYVVCIDVGEQRLTLEDLTRRLQEVTTTGDLSRWGNLRYAYVSRRPTGTRVLTVATEGRFNLQGMLPAQGDAPGQDVPGLARYPGMRRVVSAWEESQPNALGVYTVTAAPGDVRAWYRREMSRAGWTLTEMPRDGRIPARAEAARDRSLVFSRNDDATLVLVFEQSGGDTSMMSLLAM